MIVLVLAAGLVPVTSSTTEPVVECGDTDAPYTGCPDLTLDVSYLNEWQVSRESFSSSSCAVQEGLVEAGSRTLVRFPTGAPNLYVEARGTNQGDLVLGRPADHPDRFEYADCHGHYHVREFADYRLWPPDAFANWSSVREEHPEWTASEAFAAHPELAAAVVSGQKQGFCLMDIRDYSGVQSRRYGCSHQGIGLGWGDVYSANLDGQWVDVTDVVANGSGRFVLEVEVNGDRFFRENDYGNNRVWIEIRLPDPNAPGAPRDLRGETGPGEGDVKLTWRAPSDPGDANVTAYRVYRAELDAPLAFLAEVPAANGTTFNDSGRPADVVWTYAVSAVNTHGEGPLSAHVAVPDWHPPGRPLALRANGGPDVGTVTLEWEPPSSTGGAPVSAYRVYRAMYPGDTTFRFAGETGDATPTFVDADAPLGGVLVYRVTALNAAGEGLPSARSCSAAHPEGERVVAGAPCFLAMWATSGH